MLLAGKALSRAQPLCGGGQTKSTQNDEEPKLLSGYGQLAGNDPHEVNLAFVAGIMVQRTGLPREEIEELLNLLDPAGLLPF